MDAGLRRHSMKAPPASDRTAARRVLAKASSFRHDNPWHPSDAGREHDGADAPVHGQPRGRRRAASLNRAKDESSGERQRLAGEAQAAPSYERVSAMVPLPNGSMLVGGLFEQNVEFHGDVIGFSSEDSSFGVDFFLGWLDENGTWTGTMAGTSSGLDGIEAMDRTSDGTVIIAGTFCDMTKGDACNMTLGELPPVNKSADDHENGVFVAGMTPAGEWMWATSLSNPYQLSVIDMMVGPSDEVHLAVLHRDSLTSGDELAPGSVSEDSIAVLVLDSTGNHLHMHTVFSSQNLENIGSLCSDYSGQTYRHVLLGTREFWRSRTHQQWRNTRCRCTVQFRRLALGQERRRDK